MSTIQIDTGQDRINELEKQLKINTRFFQNLLNESHDELGRKNKIIDAQNRSLTQLKEDISQLSSRIEMIEKDPHFFKNRGLFKPKFIPSEVCRSLGFYSTRKLTKIAEEYKLFDDDDLAIRISRIVGKKYRKHESIVLFSQLGIFILKMIIGKKIKEKLDTIKKVDNTEMNEIIEIFGDSPDENIEYKSINFEDY